MTSTLRTLTSVLLLVSFFPVTADAFRSVDAQRPTRGNYDSTSGTAVSRGWQPPDPSSIRWSTVTTPFGVRLSYPSTWEYVKRSDAASTVSFVSVHDHEPDLTYLRASVHLFSSPAYAVDTFAKLHSWFMNKSTLSMHDPALDWYVPSFRLLQSGSVLFAGRQALRYEYTGEHQSTPFRAVQYLWLDDGQMVRLRFIAPLASYADDVEIFERMIASPSASSRGSAASSSRSSRSAIAPRSISPSSVSSSPASTLRASALRRRLLRQKTMAERRQLRLQRRLLR